MQAVFGARLRSSRHLLPILPRYLAKHVTTLPDWEVYKAWHCLSSSLRKLGSAYVYVSNVVGGTVRLLRLTVVSCPEAISPLLLAEWMVVLLEKSSHGFGG